MPIDRTTARRNLINLIQYQSVREEYGELHLALWYDIADAADDLFLFEVFEHFESEAAHEPVATYRFPGMGYLWLPGLYHVTVCSRAFFEAVVRDNTDEDVRRFRSQLAEGRAEILFPADPTQSAVARLLVT